jgi:hypothetical protein
MRFNDGRCDRQRPVLDQHHVHGHVAGRDRSGAWYCLDERGLSPAHCEGLATSRPTAGLQPGRADHVFLRLPPQRAEGLGLRTSTWHRAASARRPRVPRHDAHARPARWRRRRQRGLLLDLRQRCRPGAPVHARRANSLLAGRCRWPSHRCAPSAARSSTPCSSPRSARRRLAGRPVPAPCSPSMSMCAGVPDPDSPGSRQPVPDVLVPQHPFPPSFVPPGDHDDFAPKPCCRHLCGGHPFRVVARQCPDRAQGADVHPAGYPTVVATENMGKKLEAATNGKYKMQMFPGSVLGTKRR